MEVLQISYRQSASDALEQHTCICEDANKYCIDLRAMLNPAGQVNLKWHWAISNYSCRYTVYSSGMWTLKQALCLPVNISDICYPFGPPNDRNKTHQHCMTNQLIYNGEYVWSTFQIPKNLNDGKHKSILWHIISNQKGAKLFLPFVLDRPCWKDKIIKTVITFSIIR